MIDVSDGLLQDLGHVAGASGVRIDLVSGSLVPDQPVRDVGAAVGVDPVQLVLTGGEDHALAACFTPEAVLPERWRVVGSVAAGEPLVVVDGAPWDGPGGSDGFRRSPDPN